MKITILTGFIIVLIVYSAISQAGTHYYIEPEEVTVYQSGCLISSNFKVNLNRGSNVIYFDSLPDQIDKSSIRLSFKGKATVMSVDYHSVQTKVENLTLPENIRILDDSLLSLKYEKSGFLDEIEILKGEEKIISAYKIDTYGEKGGKITDLRELAGYYYNRLSEIRKDILGIQINIDKLDKTVAGINKLITDYKAKLIPVNNYQVTAVISSETAGALDANLSFYCNGSLWKPTYEIRVKDINSQPILVYKGILSQNTGRNWKNVKLNLSTRNPSVSNDIPNLTPWLLRLSEYEIYKSSGGGDSPLEPSSSRSWSPRRSSEKEIKVEGLSVGTLENKTLSIEYALDNLYNINSDGQNQSITINETKIDANYEYYTVPKLDRDAFLVAKIPQWGKLNLLPGEALIYFDDAYVGKTMINPNLAVDTFMLSLGRDKQIIINRLPIEEFTETKFLSSRIEKTIGYKTTIQNNRSTPIKITIKDNVPFSTHEDIEVTLIEVSNASINKESGELTWKYDILPGKMEIIKLIFKVLMPKNTKL